MIAFYKYITLQSVFKPEIVKMKSFKESYWLKVIISIVEFISITISVVLSQLVKCHNKLTHFSQCFH